MKTWDPSHLRLAEAAFEVRDGSWSGGSGRKFSSYYSPRETKTMDRKTLTEMERMLAAEIELLRRLHGTLIAVQGAQDLLDHARQTRGADDRGEATRVEAVQTYESLLETLRSGAAVVAEELLRFRQQAVEPVEQRSATAAERAALN